MKIDKAVYSKYLRQRLIMIWTFLLRFSFVETHIDKEKDRCYRVGTYPHTVEKGGEIGWLLE